MKPLRIAIRSFSDFQSALDAQIAAYRDSHPETEIQVTAMDLRSLEDSVFNTAEAWDLLIFPTDWIGAAVHSGAIENLTPWMGAQPLPEWPEGWPASLREPLRRGDDFFCIPWHDGPECLIYRKDLFEDPTERAAFAAKYGRELEPPKTWGEFRQVARFFTRPSQSDKGPFWGTLFAALPDGHNTLYDFVLQVWSRGDELYSADGAPALNHPIAIVALDFYRGLVNDPQACYPGCGEIDSVTSGDLFLSGQIAMMVNWFGFAARASAPSSPLRDRLALAPIPGGQPGQSATLSNYWVIAIGANGLNKAASYALLRHIASAASDKLAALHGAVGVRLSTWRDPEVIERAPIYAQLERLSSEARTLPFCQDLPKLAEIVNQVTIAALTTSEPSETILDRAQGMAMNQGIRLIQNSARPAKEGPQ